MTTTRYKLGRLPNAGRPRVKLTVTHRPPAYTPPESVDLYSAIPADTIGMDGNDELGDCTIADADHEAKADEVAAGNTEVASTRDEVVAIYSAVTGYTPDDPSTDQGAEMQAVREYWQKTGFTLGGKLHRILLFADLDVRNESLVKWALDQFGAIGLGINCPASAQDQFGAGEPWTVVEGSEVEGGHAIALVGYDADWYYVITWGQVQKMAPEFFRKYVEEAWANLSEEFVNAKSGNDSLGRTIYQLGQQFASLTGKSNPVPAPTQAG